jgi:NAD(P)-dependent dehydrogenase (short-subunit alcohol dehydrogenase family)
LQQWSTLLLHRCCEAHDAFCVSLSIGSIAPEIHLPASEARKTANAAISRGSVTRLAIPHLKKSSAGVIIIMSSGAGRFGYANRSSYSATKWALVGFTKTLSIELGEFGIRANAMRSCPAPSRVRGYRES